eukprot:6491928-Pyramimonas_sp.AAC.1
MSSSRVPAGHCSFVPLRLPMRKVPVSGRLAGGAPLYGYDSLPIRPRLDLDVYIDDQGLSRTGRAHDVIDSIVQGARDLQRV